MSPFNLHTKVFLNYIFRCCFCCSCTSPWTWQDGDENTTCSYLPHHFHNFSLFRIPSSLRLVLHIINSLSYGVNSVSCAPKAGGFYCTKNFFIANLSAFFQMSQNYFLVFSPATHPQTVGDLSRSINLQKGGCRGLCLLLPLSSGVPVQSPVQLLS